MMVLLATATMAMNSEVRVPLQMRDQRSCPMVLVPNQNSLLGCTLRYWRPVSGLLKISVGFFWLGR